VMNWKNICLGVALFFASFGQGQETIRLMYYNLLNFPDESPERVNELRQIIAYSLPDVIVVNELLTEAGSNLILTDALNVHGRSNYAAANFVDGPDTDNMLYYNTDKLGLVAQEQIPTGLRDISEYRLYYKSPGLSASSDTIYLNVYSLHLKAGTGHFLQRKEEAQILKYHLNSLDNKENIFAGGDFNFYSGNEAGCVTMRETGTVDLFDPINRIGDWSSNWSYADIHTQSTRTSPLADGAGGGMDDRFDLIFVSEDVLNNANGLEYLSGTYEALGQDGNRFNETIRVPYNPTVPDSIADALYFMSDHLPVLMDVLTDYTAGILAEEAQAKLTAFYNDQTKEIHFNQLVQSGVLAVYDLRGRKQFEVLVNGESKVQLPVALSSGVFIWNLTTATSVTAGKFHTISY